MYYTIYDIVLPACCIYMYVRSFSIWTIKVLKVECYHRLSVMLYRYILLQALYGLIISQ